jgi:hypothetical protein
MSSAFVERRSHNRIALRLPTTVTYRTVERFVTREMTFSFDVSPVGAGFILRSKLDVGQIIGIALPLPPAMRFIDSHSENYDIWAVVRHCNRTTAEQIPVNHIGVAFIGPYPPAGYSREPHRLFDLNGFGADGFWSVKENGKTVNRRRQERYSIPLGVSVAIVDQAGGITALERTVVENVSLGGATVFTSLPLNSGDLVKIQSEQYNVSLTAEVRNVRTGSDGLPRVHLRFIDGEFPLDGIEQV